MIYKTLLFKLFNASLFLTEEYVIIFVMISEVFFIETQDSTKKRFFIRSYGNYTIPSTQFAFPGNVNKFNIDYVTKSWIFGLKNVKNRFKKICNCLNTQS